MDGGVEFEFGLELELKVETGGGPKSRTWEEARIRGGDEEEDEDEDEDEDAVGRCVSFRRGDEELEKGLRSPLRSPTSRAALPASSSEEASAYMPDSFRR